jgi:hypothetical protein
MVDCSCNKNASGTAVCRRGRDSPGLPSESCNISGLEIGAQSQHPRRLSSSLDEQVDILRAGLDSAESKTG